MKNPVPGLYFEDNWQLFQNLYGSKGLGQNFKLHKLCYVAQALSKTTILLSMKEIDLDVEMLGLSFSTLVADIVLVFEMLLRGKGIFFRSVSFNQLEFSIGNRFCQVPRIEQVAPLW